MRCKRFFHISISYVSLIFSLLAANVNATYSQSLIINGQVLDEDNGPVEGANVYFSDSFRGTSSNKNGEFTLRGNFPVPQILIISMMGYQTHYDTIRDNGNHDLEVQLKEETFLGEEVIVSASRVEESIMLSPVTVEKLDIRQLMEMPQANFYDGLYKLKGVDMNVQSLTFKNPNTRGFNGNTNFRFNQIIDGVNNMAPGLSFSAGNLLGLSPIDIESAELLTGASSVLYGAGGLNGTLVMQSKDPFDYRGLSGSVQVGAMRMNVDNADGPTPYYDVNLRYSHVFNDRLGVKFVGNYLKADDWVANDFRDKTDLNDPTLNRYTSTGYDGVNTYGDEFALDLRTIAPDVAHNVAIEQGFAEGTPEYENTVNTVLGIFNEDSTFKLTRTGWQEKDLVNYDAYNAKANLAIHYKLGGDTRAILAGSYAVGQAIYSAQNRFSISDFELFNVKAEISNPDFFVRYWWVGEDGGTTYDAGATAALINEAWKPSEVWYQDYLEGYIAGRLGFGQNKLKAHQSGLLNADNRDERGNIQDPEKPARPLPGTPEFNRYFNDIISKPLGQGGSRVLDFSRMGQLEGMYNFRKLLNGINLIAGFQYRYFTIDSDGTVFVDEPGNPIKTDQWSAYAQYIDDFLNNRLRLNLSARWDKDENFKSEFTPRLSFVISLGSKREHNIRISAQSAFRFPSISDQWVDLSVGNVQVVGGQRQVQEKYGFFDEEIPLYPLIGVDPVTAVPDTTETYVIPPFVAETVLAYEIGYKGLMLNKNLLIDANLFLNEYDGFQGNQLLVQFPFTPDEIRYQTIVSTEQKVVNWGWSIGLDYRLIKGYVLGGNVAYSALADNQKFEPGFQTRFNTPDYRYNLYLNNRRVWKRIGFSINWRWQNSFLWESSFGVGEVPAFSTLDMQLTLQLPKMRSFLKFGSSNTLNNYYTTSLGGSQIGGLYYVSFNFDQMSR